MAFVWSLMMAVWLGFLAFGAWWLWPHFERMTLTTELVVSALWLAMGASAWLLAFMMGRARYWPR
jgi:hypothetical protein